ncbi:MFS transporter [Haloterrigena sp. SYSU A558-1]|uniref:MFS transporter n=1 Tax=Haloterrigena gelatinilytica TaxID=2741724 RepID=A0A8J8KHR6_9EURY|nr:MFS transporter [Haloterrigena gelatinilytica]NUB91454.1 MFS transporter [Haloterrigena gelatinilytica]NUC72806.1 MFS transporter [Haloterrigena gelatinilytica]
MRTDGGSAPDGGSNAVRGADSSGPGFYRGWRVVAGGFVGALVVFGLSYAFGVFLEPIQRELGLSRSGVSVVFSLQTVVIYLAAAVLGVLADRFGVRRLLSAGAAVLAVGGLWTSRADTYAGLLVAYGVCTAVGLGAIYVVSYATVPRWFGRRRGLATGIATAGLGIGMVALAPAASALVAALGWRLAILALVLVSAAAVAGVVPLFADDPSSSDAPVDAEREFPDGVPDREPPDWDAYRRELAAVALSRPFLLVFAGWVLVYATLYVVLVHVVPHASDAGLGDGTGATAIAVVGATTAVARIGIGGLADRLGRVRTFVACSAVMGLSTLWLPLAGSAIGLYAFAVVFGVAYGGNGALLSPLTVDLFGSANPNAIFGLVSLSFAVSGSIAPWLAGLTYDLTGTYTPAFVGAGLAGLVGSILIAGADASLETDS